MWYALSVRRRVEEATAGRCDWWSATTFCSSTFGRLSQRLSKRSFEPFDQPSIPCTYRAGSFSFTHNGATIPSGTYCATNQIALPASNLTGNVTFVAPKVTLSGSHLTLTPYYEDLLVFHYGTTDFNIAGSYQDLTGTVFVPNARLGLSGSNTFSYSLFLAGLYVSISGSGWTLHGTGPSLGSLGIELFE